MKNAQEIKNTLEKYIAENEAKAELWRKVERITKKDGTDFKAFAKNFGNARIYANYMRRNVIAVSGWVNGHNYISDEIDLWEYVDSTKLNPEEHEIIRESAWTREYFYLTVSEVFDKIAETIETLERRTEEYKKQLAQVDDVFTEFSNAINEALNTLAEKAGKYTSLYHECREYMKTAW